MGALSSPGWMTGLGRAAAAVIMVLNGVMIAEMAGAG
jgi:hypothetical protein